MRKLFSVLLAVIVIVFLVVVIRGAVDLPEVQKRLQKAEFINDGRLHPECQGELVIVCDALESDKDAYDDELGITLPSPCAVRYVDILTRQTDADGNSCLVWEPVRREDETGRLREKMLSGGITLGAYRISDELTEMLSPGREVSQPILNAAELKQLRAHQFYTVETGGVTYLSEAPLSSFSQPNYDFTYEGARRVHYRMIDPDVGLNCCIAGIPDGDMLVRDDTLDTRPVFDNALTRSDVVGQNGFYIFLGILITLALCAVLIFYIGRNLF